GPGRWPEGAGLSALGARHGIPPSRDPAPPYGPIQYRRSSTVYAGSNLKLLYTRYQRISCLLRYPVSPSDRFLALHQGHLWVVEGVFHSFKDATAWPAPAARHSRPALR